MYIGKVSEITEELYTALQQLIPQLTTNKTAPSWDELTALVNSESSALLIARYPDENAPIVGMLTLAIYRVPTGVRSIVEDVVVDENMRRHGIGEALPQVSQLRGTGAKRLRALVRKPELIAFLDLTLDIRGAVENRHNDRSLAIS